MAYEVGTILKTCPLLNEHKIVLQRTGHMAWFGPKGHLHARFSRIHQVTELHALDLGNSKEEAEAKLYRSLLNGHGFTYKCKFRYCGEYRTGWWVVKSLFKKTGCVTAVFVKRVIKSSPEGTYSGR